MSVYPLFLVLSQDGTLNAYAREELLAMDLQINLQNGVPARQVYELLPGTLTIIYEPSEKYAGFTEPLENLCDRHKREALPVPTRSSCSVCRQENIEVGIHD